MIAFRVFNLLLDDLINADFDEIHLYSKFYRRHRSLECRQVSAQVEFIKNSMFFEFTKKLFHDSLNQLLYAFIILRLKKHIDTMNILVSKATFSDINMQ